MSETVNLPALGESVTEGTVTRWLVEVGEEVEVDQPIVEVSTDKVDTEVPSPAAGVIEELLVGEDEEVEVGAPLVRIGDGGGASNGSSADSGESTDTEDSDDQQAPAEAAEEQAQESVASGTSDETAEEPDESEESAPADEEKSAEGDSQEVTLPALGESVTEGTVTRWLVEVGEEVEVDQPLLEVSTDKVDTEVPSPVAGTLQEIKVSEDETVEIGALLALVGSGGAPSSEAPAEKSPESAEESSQPEPPEESASTEDSAPKAKPAKQERSEPSAAASKKPQESSQSTGGAEGYVTPLVRQLAKKESIDLSAVTGSGVGGRIRKQDVLDAVEAKKAKESKDAPAPAAARGTGAPAPTSGVDTTKRGTTEKAPRIRQVIAQRMNESLEVSAQLTQVHEIDMTRIVNLRASAKESFQRQNGVKLTYLPFIATAVAEALKQHPKLNAEYDQQEQKISYHDREHLAIAVDTEKGLLVPVISDAGNLNLAGMSQKIDDVAQRTRSNKISPEELSGGTFSITNIGSVGALFDTPIINQPQVAILGTGAIVKRPMVVTDTDGNESIGIRHMMYLCLTYDHRLVDGADAGRFLQTLKARLEEGSFEAQLGL